jgi:hypothetical protein
MEKHAVSKVVKVSYNLKDGSCNVTLADKLIGNSRTNNRCVSGVAYNDRPTRKTPATNRRLTDVKCREAPVIGQPFREKTTFFRKD